VGSIPERARAYIASLPPEARTDGQRESPQFTGRVIAALYASGDFMHYFGRALTVPSWELVRRHDIDGSTPLSLRYRLGGPPELHGQPPVMPLGNQPVGSGPLCAFHSLGSGLLDQSQNDDAAAMQMAT